MNEKIGRNDLCPCGSGKKYKQCCLLKEKPRGSNRKIKATWINAPKSPNLMEKAFGDIIATTGKTFTPIQEEKPQEETPPPENR